MNVTDLRSALRQRADDVDHHDTAARVERVHAKVRRVRRRRLASAATVGVLLLVGAVSVLPNRDPGPDRQGPAATTDQPVPATDPPVIQHESFVSHSGEYDLIAATVGQTGQNTLDLDVPAHHSELLVEIACYNTSGPSGVYWVSGWTGDDRPERPDSNWCGRDQDSPSYPAVRGGAPGPWSYDTGLTIPPSADATTVHVELTQEVDENGALLDNPSEMGTYVRTTNPDAWLGVAVYTIAEPVAEVAGTKIRGLVGLNGQDYAYVDHRQTAPGARELTWTVEPATEERYFDVVAENVFYQDEYGPDAAVELVLDRDSCRVSVAQARFRTGGCLLSPGKPHTIRVTIGGGCPPEAVAGIVLYRKAG